MSRRTIILIVALFVTLCITAAAVTAIVLMTNSMTQDNAAASRPMVAAAPEKVVTVPPPAQVPSSEVMAGRVNCVRFHNIAVGGGVQGLVLDEGSCYIGSVKYAIDTFQTKASRNLWLKMAEPYGVVPKFETSHAVVYKSVNS